MKFNFWLSRTWAEGKCKVKKLHNKGQYSILSITSVKGDVASWEAEIVIGTDEHINPNVIFWNTEFFK